MKKERIFSEYWAKRKHRMPSDFIKEIEETAKKEPEETDEYGSYKTGTFLYRSCVVTVKRDDGLWSVYVFSECPISELTLKEIRWKYIPDAVTMIRLYGSRNGDESKMKGIMLYQLPTEE